MPEPTPPPRDPTPKDLRTPPNAGAAAWKPPPRKPPPTAPAPPPPPATAPPTPPHPPPATPAPPPAEPSTHPPPAVRATLRLPNQSRARKKRDPIEFSFHDFDFLCVDAFEFILLKTDNARSDHAVHRRVEILRFPLLLQCVFRLETFDDVDNAAPSHKSGDGGADSLRFAWHHRDFSCEFLCLHCIPFVVEF